MLDFINFTFLDALDILLVAVLLYYTYKLLKGTVAINIFLGIAFIFLIWKITQTLKMEMLSGILGYLLSGGVIALIIVFQQEIRKLSETKTGALIVIERTNNLDFLINTGDTMNALMNEAILESIFYKNSPLHDGAIIIRDNFIVATRVVLPISDSKIPARFGLRHKAGIGITEKTDALSLLVSEETGEISYLKNGNFELYTDYEELIEKIKKDME